MGGMGECGLGRWGGGGSRERGWVGAAAGWGDWVVFFRTWSKARSRQVQKGENIKTRRSLEFRMSPLQYARMPPKARPRETICIYQGTLRAAFGPSPWRLLAYSRNREIRNSSHRLVRSYIFFESCLDLDLNLDLGRTWDGKPGENQGNTSRKIKFAQNPVGHFAGKP